jgi:MYXO-CTERM domain-containing protein
MKRRLALLVLGLAWAAAAQDPKYLPFRMLSTAQNPFPYYLDNRVAAPAGLSIAASRPAIEAAWAQWNNTTCAMPKAASQGYTGATVPNPNDRYDLFNVTPVWVTNSADPDARGVLSGGFTVAVSVPQSFGGVLQTCDVYVNGLGNFTYSTATPTPATDIDVQSMMTHEAGHCLGLDHFGLGVMQQSLYRGEQARQLLQSDVRGICERNPAFGKTGAFCLADGGCDTDLKCINRIGTIGPSRYCASACVPNAVPCPLPLTCDPTTAIPGSANACQYPSAAVTQIGKACMMSSQCGSAVGNCILPGTGTPSWQDGYCTQGCGVGQPGCPAGSECVPSSANVNLCIASCRVGLSDCRPGYTCDTLGPTAGNAGICIPSCGSEADCIDPVVNGQVVDYDCRLCDGRCVPKQTPGVGIGTPCNQDPQCGFGQVCRQADRRFAAKQCTQSCARGCATCPAGAACVPDDRGELFCLKTCSGPRSCGSGLRCADYPGVKACIPACQGDTDCPVGQSCQDQECVLPIDPNDAGCGTFCVVPDAGRPFVPRPDAGVMTGGGNAGCACSTASAFGPMLALAALAVVARRRRR